MTAEERIEYLLQIVASLVFYMHRYCNPKQLEMAQFALNTARNQLGRERYEHSVELGRRAAPGFPWDDAALQGESDE